MCGSLIFSVPSKAMPGPLQLPCVQTQWERWLFCAPGNEGLNIFSCSLLLPASPPPYPCCSIFKPYFFKQVLGTHGSHSVLVFMISFNHVFSTTVNLVLTNCPLTDCLTDRLLISKSSISNPRAQRFSAGVFSYKFTSEYLIYFE